MGISFSKNNFLYCDQALANHMEILSGVKYVFITDDLQLTLRTAWSFLVYVHYNSFSMHLGNFIKLKKSYNRYSAFDPLFALVWCRRLSNDTKYRAGWLYSEITNWAKRDFVTNNKGRMGYFLCFLLIQKNKCALMWNYILPIYGICQGKCEILFFHQSQPCILFGDKRETFFEKNLSNLCQTLVPPVPIMVLNLWRFSVS